jgi:hypothetical protein
MSDEYDWDFGGRDDAKAEIRAAVRYLLKDTGGTDRGNVVREIIEIVGKVARDLPAGGQIPLGDGMPGASRRTEAPRHAPDRRLPSLGNPPVSPRFGGHVPVDRRQRRARHGGPPQRV